MNILSFLDDEEGSRPFQACKPRTRVRFDDEWKNEGGLGEDPFETFIAEALVLGCGSPLKPGKEATVHICPAHPRTGLAWLAVKVYKDISDRSFRRQSAYLQGRFAEAGISRRDAAHILSHPGALQAFWVDSEYRVLSLLHEAGLPVPRALGRSPQAVAMELIGDDEEKASPRLKDMPLRGGRAREGFEILLDAVDRMLGLDIVHGDLSPYNILAGPHGPVIIDFPQAVDPRFHPRAFELLERDLRALCSHFAESGLRLTEADASSFARQMWDKHDPGR